MQLAGEGALSRAVCHYGLLLGAVVVSDGAGQFRVGVHAPCLRHAEWLVHKLVRATPESCATDMTRDVD